MSDLFPGLDLTPAETQGPEEEERAPAFYQITLYWPEGVLPDRERITALCGAAGAHFDKEVTSINGTKLSEPMRFGGAFVHDGQGDSISCPECSGFGIVDRE